jgi:cytochrome c oxidase subunit 2
MVTGHFLRKMGAVSAAAMALAPALATAQEEAGYTAGHPLPGQFHLQRSVTPIMDSITAFHDGILMWTISLIVVFVLALLLWIVWRYNAKRNPNPAAFTHNTLVEIVWTVLPIVILIIIAIPSFGVLSDQLTTPDGERKYLGPNIFSFGEVEVPAASLTIKATASNGTGTTNMSTRAWPCPPRCCRKKIPRLAPGACRPSRGSRAFWPSTTNLSCRSIPPSACR